MSILTSPRGKIEVVHCRRTESQDIYFIQKLIRKFTQKMFGKLNIIYLLEKANLAITLCNDREEIMAHAIFLDYPNWNVATPVAWPSLFRELDSDIPCTPLNTLFLHLFVAVDEYSTGCCKEIIQTVFKAVPELHFIFLIVPSYVSLGSVPCLTYDEDFAVYVCHRHSHYPQLYIRRARVEDHDDLMPIFMQHGTTLKDTYGEYFLAELIEAQDEENHAVVCEVEGIAVGFMSVCSRVNLLLLHECFDLVLFHGFCVPHPDDILEPPKAPRSADAELWTDSQGSQRTAEEPLGPVSPEAMGSAQEKVMEEAEPLSAVHNENVSDTQDSDKHSLHSLTGEQQHSVTRSSSAPIQLTEEPSHFHPVYKGDPTVFCIQLFCIDKKYEARSLDFMNFVFSLFPDKNYCIISVPQLTPEFVLIQNFVKAIPFEDCTLQHDLYVFHRAGLFNQLGTPS